MSNFSRKGEESIESMFSGIEKYTKQLALSPYTPRIHQGEAKTFFILQKGLELGLSPIQSLEQIVVISGKLAVQVECLMALVYQSKLLEDIQQTEEGTFPKDDYTAVCTVKRKDVKTPVRKTFSIADAKSAGLWGKSGPWKQYPKRMMQKRVYGWTMRDVFPDVVQGLYTVEEAQDIEVVEVTSVPVEETPIVVIEKKKTAPKAKAYKPSAIYSDRNVKVLYGWFGNKMDSEVDAFITNTCKRTKVSKKDVIGMALEINDAGDLTKKKGFMSAVNKFSEKNNKD